MSAAISHSVIRHHAVDLDLPIVLYCLSTPPLTLWVAHDMCCHFRTVRCTPPLLCHHVQGMLGRVKYPLLSSTSSFRAIAPLCRFTCAHPQQLLYWPFGERCLLVAGWVCIASHNFAARYTTYLGPARPTSPCFFAALAGGRSGRTLTLLRPKQVGYRCVYWSFRTNVVTAAVCVTRG